MRMIHCEDCGKLYDYDDDGFCPHCGAFNQPKRSADGEAERVKRVDGLSEEGHEGSFAHLEFHREERERRRTGLDKSVKRDLSADSPAPSAQKSPRPSGAKHAIQKPAAAGGKGPGILFWIFLVIILVNILRACAGI
ncbi:MAG: hypothetical protein LKJ80_07205 [Oscillibacter sp.]|jgi:hypothetical protein|nr:hypothetical protein [Oscillibacter sp.]